MAGALLPTAAVAAPPELKHIFPVAAQRGAHSAVSIGKTETWPQLWCDAPGVKFTPTPCFGTYNVEVSADAPLGPHLVRAHNSDGASGPRLFIVSDAQELLAREPNDTFREAQVIPALPATIGGRLEKNGDVDVFAVSLRKGQTLVAFVESNVIASTVDALLRVTDKEGRVQAFNHDSETLDPLLAWRVPRDDTFFVQVMGFAYPPQSSVQLIGGDGCIYRLHLTTGPVARYTEPLRIKAGTKQSVHLLGWNLPSDQIEVDASAAQPGDVLPNPLGPGTVLLKPLHASDVVELVEAEPEGAPALESITVPSGVTGRIRAPREEDRYAFTAAKGHAYLIGIIASKAGSPLDAWLRVDDSAGKELGRADDTDGRDPQLTWTAPADGTFTAVIGDVTHRGGDDFLYRLSITEATPAVTATVAAHSVVLGAGKTGEGKVTVKRARGFKAPLELIAKNLPSGVTAAPVEVPEKDGETVVKFSVETTAPAASQPFQLLLREKESGREYPARYAIAGTSEENGVPQGYGDLLISSSDDLWITVTESKPAPTPATAAPTAP
jgi:hypothetical protein